MLLDSVMRQCYIPSVEIDVRGLWTIDQLGAQVALALSVDYEGAPNARVRNVPDRRTIRYYITLGLLDRPAEMRGRVAYYGTKHLLQLVAIKRLQARGLALAEVQQQLLGLTEAALRRLARLPDNLASAPPESAAADQASAAASEDRSRTFWTTTPSSVPEGSTDNHSDPALASPATHDSAKPDIDHPAAWQGVRLDEDVMLLIEGLRPIDEDDLASMRTAAAPLIKLLQRRRLVGPREQRGTP